MYINLRQKIETDFC